MGANNSTPQTVRIENSQHDLAMQVTPSVVSRLTGDGNQEQKKMECSKCKETIHEKYQSSSLQIVKEIPHNGIQDQHVFKMKYNELEEYQFDKSVEKVKDMIGKPLIWVDDINETITNLRHDLIKCYQDHPRQTLSCSDKAEQYRDFIFGEQYKTILRSSEKNMDSGFSPTPPQTQ